MAVRAVEAAVLSATLIRRRVWPGACWLCGSRVRRLLMAGAARRRKTTLTATTIESVLFGTRVGTLTTVATGTETWVTTAMDRLVAALAARGQQGRSRRVVQ